MSLNKHFYLFQYEISDLIPYFDEIVILQNIVRVEDSYLENNKDREKKVQKHRIANGITNKMMSLFPQMFVLSP